MKLQVDETVREMTAEEESEWRAWQESIPNPDDDKAEAFDILTGVSE